MDRFTEFDIIIEFPQYVDRNKLIVLARRYLGACALYTNSLRLQSNGELLGEFDKADIDSVQDWKNAPPDKVVALLRERT